MNWRFVDKMRKLRHLLSNAISLMQRMKELMLFKPYRVALALAALCFLAAPAVSQSINGSNREHIRIRSPDGRPCLEFKMEMRPEVVMDDTYDHIVRVQNTCQQRITVTICYHDAHDNCRRLKLPSYGDGTVFLGSMYNQPLFSFDYEEKEDN